LSVALIAALLAGCVKNEKEFESLRIALRNRPDIQSKGIADCAFKVKYFHIEVKRQLAGYAHTKLDDEFPRTLCKRLLSGYLSGRMKWEDYQALTRGNRQRVTPAMARVIRGG
jgi:hypothetical protein